MSSVEPLASTSADEDAGLGPDDLKALYYFMQLTRSIEDRVRTLYLQGKLHGAVYSSRGQEGTAVAAAYALEPHDVVAPLIRDLGASITRGVPPATIFAQWLGRSTAPTGGRDGNLHFGDLTRGVLPPVSMLGASLPLCAGVGLASVQRHDYRVALAFIGDGGTNTGEFHEGTNFAATLRLPLVVIVEDNGFAYSTPVHKHVAIESFVDRAVGYGIPGVSIDGNDVLAVFGATRAAVERARSGDGPTLIEAKTFRMRGHAEHDDASYVPRDLIEEWSRRDPISRLADYMEKQQIVDEAARHAIDDRIAAEIEAALVEAEGASPPDPSSQSDGLYA